MATPVHDLDDPFGTLHIVVGYSSRFSAFLVHSAGVVCSISGNAILAYVVNFTGAL